MISSSAALASANAPGARGAGSMAGTRLVEAASRTPAIRPREVWRWFFFGAMGVLLAGMGEGLLGAGCEPVGGTPARIQFAARGGGGGRVAM